MISYSFPAFRILPDYKSNKIIQHTITKFIFLGNSLKVAIFIVCKLTDK